MYLLDTAILIELGRARTAEGHAGLAGWAGSIARERLFLSALSLVEMEGAVIRSARNDRGNAAALRAWIDDQLVPAFAGHVLPVDAAVARRRGTLPLPDTRDALLAATALEHHLILVTRDRPAFKGCKVRTFDPADYRPEDAGENGDWRTAGRNGPLWLRQFFLRG